MGDGLQRQAGIEVPGAGLFLLSPFSFTFLVNSYHSSGAKYIKLNLDRLRDLSRMEEALPCWEAAGWILPFAGGCKESWGCPVPPVSGGDCVDQR